jgi:hypothetical protein
LHTICLFCRVAIFQRAHQTLFSTALLVADLDRPITPACAAEKRGHAFYARVFQSAPCCVKKEAQNTTILFSTASTAFIFPRHCFLLFPAFDLTQLLIFTTPPFCLFHALYF